MRMAEGIPQAMNSNEKATNDRSILLTVLLLIISVGKGADISINNIWFRGLVLFGMLLGLVSFLSIKQIMKKDIVIICLVALLGMTSFIVTNKEGLMMTCITIVFMYGFDVTTAIKTIFWGRLISFVLLTILTLTGIIQNTLFIYWREEFITRYSLGFGHPNTAHMAFCILVTLYLYLYYSNINLFKCLILFACNYWLYTYTASRGGFYVCALAIILFYICKRITWSQSLVSIAAICIIPAVLCFSFGTVFLFGKGIPLINTLNTLMTGRLRIAHTVFNIYGISLFGDPRIYFDSITIDDGYIFTILQYGLIPFILLVLAMFSIALYARKENDVRISLLILVMSIYTLNESFFPNIYFNIALFIVPSIIYQKNREVSVNHECAIGLKLNTPGEQIMSQNRLN